MHPRLTSFVLVLTFCAVLLACGQAGQPTLSTSARATGLAQTAAALLTSTAAARATLATPTPVPPSATLEPPATALPEPTDTLVPVSPDTPTAAASPTPCENDSAFVSDVNVPDGAHFAPGTDFVKIWRMRNDGVCTWTTAYTFRHVSGDAMGGARINLATEVAPGSTVDLSVSLTAPGSNGTYTGEWQLHSPDGVAFGSKPFVEIIVP